MGVLNSLKLGFQVNQLIQKCMYMHILCDNKTNPKYMFFNNVNSYLILYSLKSYQIYHRILGEKNYKTILILGFILKHSMYIRNLWAHLGGIQNSQTQRSRE